MELFWHKPCAIYCDVKLYMSLAVIAYTKRMRIYFAEMFPIPQHALLAFLTYLSIAVFAGWAEKKTAFLASWYTLLGAWSVFDLWLILRLMDELKDEEIDRELFPDRPLPSGRVSSADIKRTLAGAMILYIVAHCFAGAALWTASFVLGYSVLMFKRFFAPELLRKSLIITLVTHNPIVPLMLAQGFMIFAAENGLSLKTLRWDLIVPFVVMLWLPLLAWELARKIRSPEQENAYMTYSRLLGRFQAVAVTAAIQTIAFSIGLYFWRRFSLSWVYLAILTFGLAVSFEGYRRFVLHPSPRTAKLKHYAAAFLACTELAQLIGFGRLVWRLGN
jgi:4-hydroxybenzoate polyprenyltransferase